jgi:MraZ protein
LNVPGFYNSYDLKLDGKSRLFIPAEVRRLIKPEEHGSAFFVILGRDRHPWLYPELCYRAMVMREMTADMSPEPEMLAYQHRKLSMADLAAWDEQGRLVMPEKVLVQAGIGKDVALCGVWDHLELWNRADWDKYTEQLVANTSEVETKGKQAMKAAKNSQ